MRREIAELLWKCSRLGIYLEVISHRVKVSGPSEAKAQMRAELVAVLPELVEALSTEGPPLTVVDHREGDDGSSVTLYRGEDGAVRRRTVGPGGGWVEWRRVNLAAEQEPDRELAAA